MRFFLELAYKGTQFHGYQAQPNAFTVQSEIERVLSILIGNPTPVVGCGRTDTGVHAAQYFLHFDTDSKLDLTSLIYKLNAIVHPDIVFFNIIQVDELAHARFDAISRSYTYHLDLKRDPFRQDIAYFFPLRTDLNIERMNQAVKALLSFSDFWCYVIQSFHKRYINVLGFFDKFCWETQFLS